MSLYEDFIQARDVVISAYPDAICKYAFGSFKVFETSTSDSFLEILGSSLVNEPDAWLNAADWVQCDFLNKLEK